MDDGNNKTGDLAVASQTVLFVVDCFVLFFPIQYILEIIIHSKGKLQRPHVASLGTMVSVKGDHSNISPTWQVGELL